MDKSFWTPVHHTDIWSFPQNDVLYDVHVIALQFPLTGANRPNSSCSMRMSLCTKQAP